MSSKAPPRPTTAAAAAAAATSSTAATAITTTAVPASGGSTTVAASGSKEKIGIELCKGINGLEKVILRELRGSSAEALFKPPKPICGGIPLCFPQFSNHGPLEPHGFARNRLWSIDTNPPPFPTVTSNRAFVDLILKPTEEDMKIWPHRFEFRLRVSLSPAGDLLLASRIRNTNTDGKPFSFTFA